MNMKTAIKNYLVNETSEMTKEELKEYLTFGINYPMVSDVLDTEETDEFCLTVDNTINEFAQEHDITLS